MSTAASGNAAHDAAAATGPGMSPDEERAHRIMLAGVYADEAEQAVKDVRATIRDLDRSLKDRDPAGAKATRARIRDLKVSLKDREVDAKRLRAEAKEKP